MGSMRNTYNTFTGKSEMKRPRGILKCRWEDNIKMNLIEIWSKSEFVWIRIASSDGILRTR
jgi:hypothetical protein